MASLSPETLDILTTDMTHILDRNGKEAFVYLGRDGVSHMLLETGETRAGRWRRDEDGYIAEWDTGAVGRWSIEAELGALTYVNRDSAARIRVSGVLFGNARGLPRQP